MEARRPGLRNASVEPGRAAFPAPIGPAYAEQVFERFTERARQVVVLAQDEARALKHNYIGTEHILLGLLREEDGLAARVLESAWRAGAAAAAGTAPLAGELPPYQPASPPVAREVVEEIELARREREQAVEAKAFERAVAARDRQRNLVAAARALERAWETPVPPPLQPQPALLPSGGTVTLAGMHRRLRSMPPRRVAEYGPGGMPTSPISPIVLGWLLFALALSAGIPIGWAIWGL